MFILMSDEQLDEFIQRMLTASRLAVRMMKKGKVPFGMVGEILTITQDAIGEFLRRNRLNLALSDLLIGR